MGFRIRRFVTTLLMRLSAAPIIGHLCLRLAGVMRGPYKDRRILANLTPNPYISPRAQVHGERIRFGAHCFVDDDVTIYCHPDGGEIVLGEGVHVYRGTIIEVGQGGSVTLGAHTHVQSHCNIKGFMGSTRIGEHVQIAPHCGFSPYEHGFDDTNQAIRDQAITSKGDIVIEDDVWLGLHVQVLDGVTIGRGTVVGAGAVVTRSLPAQAIAVGVPAKVVRRRGVAESGAA